MTRRWLGTADLEPLRSWAEVVASGTTGAELWAQTDAIEDILRARGGVRLCDPEDLAADATVAAVCMVGSPSAMAEVPPSGDEVVMAVQTLQSRLGRNLDAVVSLDFAGINAFWPLVAAAQLDLPVVDSDGMGRILPLVEQTVYTLGGLRQCPMALVGPSGELLLIDGPETKATERVMRAAIRSAGGWMMCACYPMSGADLARTGLTGTVSRGLSIGRELNAARDAAALENVLVRRAGAQVLGRGQIVDVEQRNARSGAAISNPSSIIIDLFGGAPRALRLEVADSPLAVFVDGALVAAVPDIPLVIDMAAAAVRDVDRVGVGDQVSVVVCPAAAEWHTPAGRRLVGPQSFGLGVVHPRPAVADPRTTKERDG